MSTPPIPPQSRTAAQNFTREIWEQASPEVLSFLGSPEVVELLDGGQELSVELAAIEELVEDFENHILRSPKHGMVRIAWQNLKEAARQQKITPSILVKFARRTKVMLEHAHKRRLEGSLLESLLNMTDLNILAPNQLQDIEPHQGFLTEFGRSFKCRPELAEAVASGLHIYLEEADTRKLLAQRTLALENFAIQHGYHCVRRGSLADLSHGHSSQKVSRWTFIKL